MLLLFSAARVCFRVNPGSEITHRYNGFQKHTYAKKHRLSFVCLSVYCLSPLNFRTIKYSLLFSKNMYSQYKVRMKCVSFCLSLAKVVFLFLTSIVCSFNFYWRKYFLWILLQKTKKHEWNLIGSTNIILSWERSIVLFIFSWYFSIIIYFLVLPSIHFVINFDNFRHNKKKKIYLSHFNIFCSVTWSFSSYFLINNHENMRKTGLPCQFLTETNVSLVFRWYCFVLFNNSNLTVTERRSKAKNYWTKMKYYLVKNSAI